MIDLLAAAVHLTQQTPLPTPVSTDQGAAPEVPFDITELLQYGLLGLICLCILFRKFLVPEWTLRNAEERAKAEKEELSKRLGETRDQLERLQDVFQDQMIPALTRATEVNARYNDELQRARYSRQPRSTRTEDEE